MLRPFKLPWGLRWGASPAPVSVQASVQGSVPVRRLAAPVGGADDRVAPAGAVAPAPARQPTAKPFA